MFIHISVDFFKLFFDIKPGNKALFWKNEIFCKVMLQHQSFSCWSLIAMKEALLRPFHSYISGAFRVQGLL